MIHHSIPHTLAIAILVTLSQCYGLGSPAQGAENPNIVIILADDMGYGDLQAFNPQSKIITPHLDNLAKRGMCFTDAHSGGSTCVPSRYSLLTGRFAARKGRFNTNSPVIAGNRQTVANMLHDNGYRTAMVGKWHLGFDRKSRMGDNGQQRLEFDYGKPLTGGPVDRGFDSFFGMHASLDIQPYFYIKDDTAVMPPTERVGASDSVGGKEDWNRIQGAFWREGDIAPDFEQDSSEGIIKFHEWLGTSWGVLFSHPADFTPVCTTELGLTAKLKDEFAKRNVKAIALSVDPVDSHHEWIKDINETQHTIVNFPILADSDRKVSTLYDMIHPNANATLTVRSLFVIDPDKKIPLTITYPASTGRNFNEILRVIDSLQLTEYHKVATPGNWQDGDDVVIVPSLQDPAEIAERFPKGHKVIRPYLRMTPQPNK